MWKILSGFSRENAAIEERVREGGNKDTEEGGGRREDVNTLTYVKKKLIS